MYSIKVHTNGHGWLEPRFQGVLFIHEDAAQLRALDASKEGPVYGVFDEGRDKPYSVAIEGVLYVRSDQE